METQIDRDTVSVSDTSRVAIVAKFHGPTNSAGARISVTAADKGRKRIYVSWDYSLGIHENYTEAVRQYVTLMGWGGNWVVGGGTDIHVAVWTGYVGGE